jgi:hypothetical protein
VGELIPNILAAPRSIFFAVLLLEGLLDVGLIFRLIFFSLAVDNCVDIGCFVVGLLERSLS